jgi:hypothetical protein
MKTNVTLKLDVDLLREARVVAAEEGRSISALLTDRLEPIVRERKAFDRARRRASPGSETASISSGRRPPPATSSMSDNTSSLPDLFWDALVVQAAQVAGAEILYSEDLSDGQTYGTVRVINPLRVRA